MTPVHFGFLPETTRISWDGGASSIEPLAEHQQIVANMLAHPQVSDGWYYPPMVPVKTSAETPLIPTKSFALPASHQISLENADASDEQAHFFIALFGMLKGRRLQRPEWQHFYKVPIASKLADFDAKNTEIARALDIAATFWRQHSKPEIRKLAFATMHWHLFAQLYEQPFERFNAQYMALDACAELALLMNFPAYPTNRPHHAVRATKLCECTGVPKPSWVELIDTGGKKTCALAQRRNALAHEALYGGQPVGFAHPEDHKGMTDQLPGLVARIFLRLLGVNNEYTRSECTAFQTIGFDFHERK